eukprot:TRINITY_DN15408_c0_g1_i1.p1 TRINITY_DN15408_c0_g1~~TRINITY_DN15408_c0_g1_i1.p1  ORF type:complete len:513 (-),score=90.99 TRINITY_DN15408_c0_g1_i1:84-1622(-)
MMKASFVAENQRTIPFSRLQTIRITIPDHNFAPENSSLVLYSLSIALSSSQDVKQEEPEVTWVVPKRFSEFVSLNEVISKACSSITSPFPSKLSILPSWISSSIDMNAIYKRQDALQAYMQCICKIPAVLRMSAFQEFIGLESNAYLKLEVETLPPVLQFTLNDPRYGVNSLIYDEKYDIVLSACEDPNLFSKMNSYIANAKLPWESKPISEIPVGVMNVWGRIKADGGWDVASFQEYLCPASAIAWDSIRNRCFVGLETGVVKVYNILEPFTEISHFRDLQIHSARVSEMIYESETDLLITCSRDKSVCLFHVASNQICSQIPIANTWIMSMALDSVNRRLFCGYASGVIAILDISGNKISELHTLWDHKECARSLFYHPSQEYLFSGCFDSSSNIWKVGKPGNEHTTQVVGTLKGGPSSKVKAVLYLPSYHLVVTGFDNGALAFWSTKNAALEFCYPDQHTTSIVVLSWVHRSSMMVSASRDGNIRFWKFRDPPVSRKGSEVSLPDIKSD